jgi:hypothetical protein
MANKLKIEFIKFYGVELEVHYHSSFDAGYLRNSNGDGLPPSLDFDIANVYIGTSEVAELIMAGDLWEELEERIKEIISEHNEDNEFDFEDYAD